MEESIRTYVGHENICYTKTILKYVQGHQKNLLQALKIYGTKAHCSFNVLDKGVMHCASLCLRNHCVFGITVVRIMVYTVTRDGIQKI